MPLRRSSATVLLANIKRKLMFRSHQNSMGSARHLLLLLLILPFANCKTLNVSRCEKPSDKQSLLSNARTVVIILVKLTPINGFGQFSYGYGTGAVHGLAWCHAERPPLACSDCLFEASEKILRNCHNSLATRSWFGDFCYLRYDIDNFVGKPDTYLANVGFSKNRVVGTPEHRSSFITSVHHLLKALQLMDATKSKQQMVARFAWRASFVFLINIVSFVEPVRSS